MVYQTEKQLDELADKVPEDIKAGQGKLDELKASLQGEDVEAIKSAQEALQQEVVSLGQAIYSAGRGGGGGRAPPPPGGPDPTGTESSKSDVNGNDDNVVDAEFRGGR